MAKILTGPLAAGLSGKLGPVVFHQTKFGQIVQSKAKPRTYTTAPAMASKQAFGRAARCYQLQGSGLVWNLNEAFGKVHKTGQGQFVSICSEAIRDGGTQRQSSVGQPDVYTLGAITPGGPADYYLPFSVSFLASPDYQLVAARAHYPHLRRIVGRYRAFDLLFTGRVFDARETMGLGLVSRTAPAAARCQAGRRAPPAPGP